MIVESPRPPTGPIDVAFIAPLDEDEALYFAAKVRSRLVAGGQLWIVNLASPALAAALGGLGYRSGGMSGQAGGITLTGFVFQSPTT